MGLSDELERLQRLRDSGALTDEEFAQAKATLLQGGSRQSGSAVDSNAVKWWAVALHLSQFAGYLVPLAGFVVPIVIWQTTNQDYPEIDQHGRTVANWIISDLIYLAISGVFVLVGIGVPLLIVLGVLGIIFPIIGAVNAATGRCWQYPITIKFFGPRF